MNALLTQMDRLKSWPNVIILTTSNITTAIGMPAFSFFYETNPFFFFKKFVGSGGGGVGLVDVSGIA